MNFILENWWLIAVALFSGGALAWQALEKGSKISLLQATQIMNAGNSLILDVRDAEAYAAGHLRDARNIPAAELAQRTAELEKYKSKPVVVVCQSGAQSIRALAILKRAGFTAVYSMDGGIAAWQEQGLPVTR